MPLRLSTEILMGFYRFKLVLHAVLYVVEFPQVAKTYTMKLLINRN